MKIRCHLLSIAFAVWLASAHAGTGAMIEGTVKDPQGRPVAGAKLTLFLQLGSDSRGTISDSSGHYRFDQLPAGEYMLRAEVPGFATFLAEAIHVDAGSAASEDVALQLGAVRQEIVVTASSTPQAPDEVSKAVTVIDRAEADERNAMTVSDVVDLAPGVRVQQLGGTGAFTSIQIRGLRDEDTAVLVDGLRLRDASATQADATGLLEDLLFTDASRAEVLRGSGSSLYGTNAIGGVINVLTDQGGGRAHGSLLLEGGSLGTFRGRAQVAGGFLDDRIDYSLGVMQVDVTSGVNGDSPFRDTSAQGLITYHLSPAARLTARLYTGNSFGKITSSPDLAGAPPASGIVNAVPLSPALLRLYEGGVPLSQLDAGNATFIPAPDDPDSTRAARFISGALILTGQAAPALDYAVSYQAVSTSRRYGNGPAGVGYQPEGNTRSLYDGRVQTLNARLDYRLGGWNQLSGGYEFESENFSYDNADSSNLPASSAVGVNQLSHSVFAQDQVRLFDDRLQLSGAFRAQYFVLDAPQFNPAASAPYQGIAFPAPSPAYTGDGSAAYYFRGSGTKLRAHLGRGYRSPSLFERFGAGFDPVFGYTVYGDPGLHPEHSLGVDAGVDQTFLQGRFKASATYFYTWLQDVINFDTSGLIDPMADPFGRSIGYINAPGGISRGVELSASFSPIRSMSLTSAYTFVSAIERTPIVGDVLRTFNIPRNQFSIVAAERFGSRVQLTCDTLLSTNYLAPIYGSAATLVYRFGGIHKVNLEAGYRKPLAEQKAVRFFLRTENIFNQTYFESGFPTMQRTAIGGMQFEF